MNTDYIVTSLNEMIKEPKCELNYNSDYTLLIAILLSAQSLDKNVNKITPILFSKYPTLIDLMNANIDDLIGIIRPIGLASNKAKAIKSLATILVTQYNGKVPTNRDVLSTLPGIGIKTSGVFLAEFYNQNYLPVDTHVKRVAYRLGLTKENDSIEKIEEKLSSTFKYQKLNELHLILVLFGRYICKSQTPKCQECKFNGMCTITR